MDQNEEETWNIYEGGVEKASNFQSIVSNLLRSKYICTPSKLNSLTHNDDDDEIYFRINY